MKPFARVGCGCAVAVLLLFCGMAGILQQSEFQPAAQSSRGEEPGSQAKALQPGAAAPVALAAVPSPTAEWVNPNGWVVTSPFGWRIGTRGWPWYEWHGGVDLAGGPFVAGAPMYPLQDGLVFDIRFEGSRYTNGGLCIEIYNQNSFEEGRTMIGYCHFAPYQIRGQVIDADTGNGIEQAVVYIMTNPSDPHDKHIARASECGICDNDHDGQPDYSSQTRWGEDAVETGADGRYCYDYSTPDGGHTVVVEIPTGWELLTPDEVPFEIRVDEGVRSYDVEIDFYAHRPPEPTPTPTPLPTVPAVPGSLAEPTPRAGVQEYNYGPRYVVGHGPSITTHSEIKQGQTRMGELGYTGRMTGPHLHLTIEKQGMMSNAARINKYLYDPPRCTEEQQTLYPWACDADGYVRRRFLVVNEGIGRPYMTGSVDPMQFLPLANNEFGLVYMDQPMSLPPPGYPAAGEGLWWSPGDLYSDRGGGRMRGYSIWRWFSWKYQAFCTYCQCCPD